MPEFIKRFLNFDDLIATTLIKILYWVGLGLIALGILLQLFGAIVMLGRAPLAALGLLVAIPIGAAIAVLIWRFICEMYIVIFGIYERLGEIRDKP